MTEPRQGLDARTRDFITDLVPEQVRWAGDRCSVCDSDVDFDFDQLVSCDMCGITVHQSCYGVPELPGVDDMWLCRACELKVGPHGAHLCHALVRICMA